MDYKQNEIKLELGSYRHYWRGEAKIGKTTLYRDLVIEEYGDAKYGILLSIGDEMGYKALDKIYAHECPTWGEFVDTVDDLVENKEKNKFKIVAIDTVDELVKVAERKVLDIHRSIKGESATSINSALGGFGAGKKRARTLIEEQISRLERSGYGMFYIGHTRLKDVTEKATDLTYQLLTGSLEISYDEIFSNRADVRAMITNESSVKDGRKSKTDRFIYFRQTNFIDAGSRIDGLPEKISLSAKDYASSFKNALSASSGLDKKGLSGRKKEEEENRETTSKEYINKEVSGAYGDTSLPVEEYRDALLVIAKALSVEASLEKKSELKRKKLPESFSNLSDMNVLKEIYKVLTS